MRQSLAVAASVVLCAAIAGCQSEKTASENAEQPPAAPTAAAGQLRAVMISSPLKLPPGGSYSSMVIRFYPDQVVQ